MDYDPIKDRLGAVVERHPLLQRLFFGLLNMLFLRAWYVRREIHRILGAKGRSARVLDAGTGFGQYAWFVARSFPGAHVHAIDVKPEYLERARRFVEKTPQRRRITFAQDDLTDLKVDGPFDLILCVDVMEHIEEDEAVLSHFVRVLAPGGHVIINTPSDKGGSDVQEESDRSFIGEHVREGYSPEEMEAKLRRAGLEPAKSLYTYGPYGSAAWRMLIKRPLQWIGVSWATLALLPFYYAVVLPAGVLLHALDMRRENEAGTGLLVVARKPAA